MTLGLTSRPQERLYCVFLQHDHKQMSPNWNTGFDRDMGPDGRDRFPVDLSEKPLAGVANMAGQGWERH